MPLRQGELNRLRRRKGMTLTALAQASGVNRQHISRRELKPDASVYIDTARKLCRGLLGPAATDEQLGQLLAELCVLDPQEVTNVHS